MNNKINAERKSIRKLLAENYVVLFFIVLTIVMYAVSGSTPMTFLAEIVNRFSRNAFIVLALIIPVIAGLGLNFGIVIGALAGMMAVIHVVSWGYTGFPSFVLSLLLATPIAVLFGWLVAKVMNKAKGNEMIIGLILGYLANGLYQFVYLFLIGTIIPFPDKSMLIASGVGIKSSLTFNNTFKDSLGKIWTASFTNFAVLAFAAALIWTLFKLLEKVRRNKKDGTALQIGDFKTLIELGVVTVLVFLLYKTNKDVRAAFNTVTVPMACVVLILLLCLFNNWIMKTKLGHDFRAVGQNQQVASVAGINVDRTRIAAMILSTIFASWGMIIRLQDIGTMNTYSAHEQIGLTAIAAVLVGGATVQRATNKQAILGVILFNAMFAVSPQVGVSLFADSQIGEYFRVFLAYGIIFVALAMNATQQSKAKKDAIKAAEAAADARESKGRATK